MTIRDVLVKHNFKDALVELRCRAPGETMDESIKNGGILEGYARCKDFHLGPHDEDFYSIDFDIYDYDYFENDEDGILVTAWEDCQWSNEEVFDEDC